MSIPAYHHAMDDSWQKTRLEQLRRITGDCLVNDHTQNAIRFFLSATITPNAAFGIPGNRNRCLRNTHGRDVVVSE